MTMQPDAFVPATICPVEGGVVAVLRLDAIALRPLGPVYELVVNVDGAAVARRVAMGKGYSS